MNNYFENPLYRNAFFEDTDRIMAGFQKDFSFLKSGANKKDALKNIHRYAHSLKGLSAMMEFKESEQIAANLESAAGQALKNGLVGLDENILIKIKNGFDKIWELLKCIKDDARSPAARRDAPACNPQL
ncbi:MAG: Hpt domain-containing protein [Verrucomicrobia bacterium]|nr:Hpt domain-containing protein [Verrucomicrobiota bacterium]MBU1735575.1 Hpt domain-containing protein [Verrucomicrobiota bacterium]